MAEGSGSKCSLDPEFLEERMAAMGLTKKGAPKYIVIRDMPCRLLKAELKKKATNKGNDRVELTGAHIETGKKYVDTVRGDVAIPVVKWENSSWQLLDVDASDGMVSLMDDEGTMKEDANLRRAMEDDEGAAGAPWDAVGMETIERFEAGEELTVVVFSALGKDVIAEVKVAEDGGED